MNFDDLNERGLRDGLIEYASIKRALRAQLQNAEAEVGRYEAEASSLRKLDAGLDQVVAHMRARLDEVDRRKKEPGA